MSSGSQPCPACRSSELHVLPTSALDDRAAQDCSACGWLYWPEDNLGCDRCRLHWSPQSRDRRGYSIPRAALLLRVTAEEMEALYADNLDLRRSPLTEVPVVRRIPLHGLAAALE